MEFGMAEVAGITVICYLAGQIAKNIPVACRWIPCIVGGLGCILGILGLYYVADFPASDPLTAAAVGIVSGLASTGVHQIRKQLSKENQNDNSKTV